MLNLVNLKHGSSDGRASDSRSKGPRFNPRLNQIKLSGMNVTDGRLYLSGTTSVPKSVLRYTEDKARQGSETEV